MLLLISISQEQLKLTYTELVDLEGINKLVKYRFGHLGLAVNLITETDKDTLV